MLKFSSWIGKSEVYVLNLFVVAAAASAAFIYLCRRPGARLVSQSVLFLVGVICCLAVYEAYSWLVFGASQVTEYQQLLSTFGSRVTGGDSTQTPLGEQLLEVLNNFASFWDVSFFRFNQRMEVMRLQGSI